MLGHIIFKLWLLWWQGSHIVLLHKDIYLDLKTDLRREIEGERERERDMASHKIMIIFGADLLVQ